MEIKITVTPEGAFKLDIDPEMGLMTAIAMMEIAKNMIINKRAPSSQEVSATEEADTVEDTDTLQ